MSNAPITRKPVPPKPANLIPDGIYRGVAVTCDFQKSGKQGTDMMAVVCEITQEGNFKGRRLQHEGYFKDDEKSKRCLQTLMSCGWDGNDLLAVTGPVGSNRGGFGTREVDLVVQSEEPQPKDDGGWYPWKNRIAFINEPGSGAIGQSMTEQEKIQFTARLMGIKDQVVAAQKGKAGPQNSPSAGKQLGSSSPKSDDEIPF